MRDSSSSHGNPSTLSIRVACWAANNVRRSDFGVCQGSTMARFISSFSITFLHSRVSRLSPIFQHGRGLAQSASPGDLPPGWTPSLLEEAKRWVSTYRTTRSVSKQDVDVSFARSTGPGGQVSIQFPRIRHLLVLSRQLTS